MVPRLGYRPTCLQMKSRVGKGSRLAGRSGAARPANASAHGRCSGVWKRHNAAGHSDRDLPPAAHWDLLPYRGRGGVLLPIIGSSYGQALENGEIELRYDTSEGSFSAWYFEHRLPIAPERYSEILRSVVREAGADASAAGQRILELASRSKGLRHPNR